MAPSLSCLCLFSGINRKKIWKVIEMRIQVPEVDIFLIEEDEDENVPAVESI